MENVIEVPPHFLCPISLELMRDPVTISTGITYDRDSIERWLFSCNNTTCPVTKLILSPSDRLHIIPNHNLRRLIQSWCILHGVDRIPTPKAPVDASHLSKLISDARRLPNTHRKCLQRLKSISNSGIERNRKHLEASGAVGFLASVIIRRDDWADVSDALSILHQMDPSDGNLRSLINDQESEALVDSLLQVLRRGQGESRALAVSLVGSIYRVADPNKMMSARPELFVEIVRVLKEHMQQQQIITSSLGGLKSGLRLLSELNPWGRNRIKAINAGAVECMVELLLLVQSGGCSTCNTAGTERRVCEMALNVLDQLCGCAEGRVELLRHGAGLAVVSKKILRVSNAASDRAVKILGAVAKHCANGRVLGEMLEVGVVAKLCLVLQVECGLKAKERAMEILRLHSRAWKNSPCIPPHLLYSDPSYHIIDHRLARN
ncbi:hypothetical protein Dimus_009313 [Dionaea muscipula]